MDTQPSFRVSGCGGSVVVVLEKLDGILCTLIAKMDIVGNLEVRWTQGFTSQHVEFVDQKTACYTCGNYVVFLNMETQARHVLQCPGRGIGAFAANGNHGILAFSEHKLNPSIFVFNYPELELKNELKGTALLDYTSLTISDCGPYLACCSAIPDCTITVWNWDTGELLCTQPHAGRDITSLVINPVNWLQICALGAASLTVWNVEKSDNVHIMKKSVIDLPGADGSFIEKEVTPSHTGDSKLTYFGPQMPTSAITRLTGDKADTFVPHCCVQARLTPSAICWTASSKLYVGCKEGFLLLVDPESLSVSVLVNPTAADAFPELRKGSFESLALHTDGLIAAGKESVMHCLQIKGTHMEITHTWDLEEPATTLTYSPSYESLLLASAMGRIYMYKPAQPEKVVKVLDVLRGDFVAGASLHTDSNLCVSVRESGELQLWSADGFCVGSISLHAKVTGLACCPVSQYAAVGTASGHVLFIQLALKQQPPRLVHKVHLCHAPVDHLVFDQGGNYLITGASDSHVYVLEAKPSKRFSVIGYTVVPGPVVSLSTQYMKDCMQVKVLALCTGEKDREHEGSLLKLLSLPVEGLTGPACVDPRGCLSNNILLGSTYELPHALQSSVLGVTDVFAYCHQRKTLQRFQLPEDPGRPSGQEPVRLSPAEEVEGHPLGPASLILSPHHSWLASVGQDGLLRIQETTSLGQYVEMQCHSYRLGGVGSVSFSADSRTLLTAGSRDGSLVCTELRLSVAGAGKGDEATQHCRSMAVFLADGLEAENHVLGDLPDRVQVSTEPQEEEHRVPSADVTKQGKGRTRRPSAPTSDPTWQESKLQEVVRAENEQYSQTKKGLRRAIKDLHDTIQEMMRENEALPEAERLGLQEFNLDAEEQRRLQAEQEQEVARVRNEIEMGNLEKRYLRDVLKKERWDLMKVKGKAIKAFHSEHEVQNYLMREQTEEELECLLRVQSIRKIEEADSILQQAILGERSKTATDKEEEEEEEEEGHKAENSALTGSLSAQLGCSNPYLYDQFNLHIREQKINQIILLKDVIHQVKTAFNGEFEAVHRQKELEISRVKEKNRRIREIMAELGVTEPLWEPSLSASEQPESALTVDDSEIKVERYLSPELRKKEEQEKKLEAERRLAAKGDGLKERALGNMMDGVLELRKEDILKLEIPQPEFVVSKPDSQWSEEEKKIYKEYEKKSKEMSEEQEKYIKTLETEMKKLQASIKDTTQALDETLTRLFERKVKSEMVIYQEELKIANLVYSILTEEEVISRETELGLRIEKKRAYKSETGEELEKYKADAEEFRESYDNVVAEDRLLDKGFRKEFFDVPSHVVDNLYKLYKRRPRVQGMRTQTDTCKERPARGRGSADRLHQMLTAMEELDSRAHMPEGLAPSTWEHFCLVRRAKVESEQQVKMKALTLAEMQAFLQRRIDEDETAKQEIKYLVDELNGLREEKLRFLLDIMVQILIKQGQVEVGAADLIPDFSDSVLHPRSAVEDVNGTIRMLGEQKIAWMVECKDFRKGIIQQEWEHKRMTMQIEDFNTKARDIQMLRVSEEVQEYLSDSYRDNSMAKQVSTLDKTIALQETTHQKNVQHHKKLIKQLNMQAETKGEKNGILDQQISSMQVAVAERRHIYEAIAVEEAQRQQAEQRYQETVQRKALVDLARAQAEDLALLNVEVERLLMRNYPAFGPLTHN